MCPEAPSFSKLVLTPYYLIPQCKGYLVPHEVPKNIECCYKEDMCNQYLVPAYRPMPLEPSWTDDLPMISFVLSMFIFLAIFVLILALVYIR
jgi:hypothetical protein